MEEVTEAVVEELVQHIEEARAGQISLYGLFRLIEELEPVPGLLERARRRRDEGGQLSGALKAAVGAEAVLANAPTEMKRTLAEDLDRAVQVEGVTARERTRALSFIELQLKAAAKDNSEKGAMRRSKLKEKRTQLETCPTIGESKEVLRLEKSLQGHEKEFKGAREAYEMWQAGRLKFSSNTELQACKRRYETLNKQVSTSQAELEVALRRRRPPGSSTLADAGAWNGVGAAAAPKAKAVPDAKASAPRAKAKAAVPAPARRAPVAAANDSGSEDGMGGEGGAHWPTLGGEQKASPASPASRPSKAKVPSGDAQEEDGGNWQRRTRVAPDTREQERKREAQREAKNMAKRRGQELMAELGAELRGVEAEPVQAARGGYPQPAAQQQAQRQERPRQGWQAVPAQVRAELEANRAEALAPAPASWVEEDLGQQAEEEELELADGWEAVWSEENSSYYYWNTSSDDVQWEKPVQPRRAGAAAAGRQGGGRRADGEEDFGMAEVSVPASSSGHASAAAGQGKKKKAQFQQPPAEEAQRPSAAKDAEAARRRATAEAIARARKLARGDDPTGFWDDTPPPAGEAAAEEGPRLSYECVCTAVAAELGLTAAEVRDLGVSSVSEWCANFSREEWANVQARAIALEGAKKAQAQKAEKDRAARHLARIAESHGAAPTPAPAQRPSPKAAAAAKAAAATAKARGAGGPGPGPGPAQPQGKKGGKKKSPEEKMPTAALESMSHRNRFANFCDSDSDDS